MYSISRIWWALLIITSIFAQNKALYLNGEDAYVSLQNPIINTMEFSLEAWFLIFGDGGGVEQQNYIFIQRADASGCYNCTVAFSAKVWPDIEESRFSIRTDAGCSDIANSLYAGSAEWHHLAGVCDGTNLELYSDGQLIATTPVTQQGNIAMNVDYTEIGRHRHDHQNYGFFFGLIDEVRIWNYPLTQSEIITRMYSELDGNESGLLAYWNFNDGTAYDLTQNGNDGTFMGAATTVDMDLPTSINGNWGDLNDDGQLDISDVILLINHILGM